MKPGLSTCVGALLACSVSLAGCMGNIGEPGAMPGPGPGPGPGPIVLPDGAVVPPDATGPQLDCRTPTVAMTPMRRLTRSEYNNTVRDLLGDTTRPGDGFPPDDDAGGFNNNALAQTVSVLLSEQYIDAAERLATAAVRDLPRLTGCATAPTTAAAEMPCVQTFVTRYGRRFFRRPLAADEVTRYVAMYTTARAASDYANGIQTVLQAFMVSPHFLFRPEFGDTARAMGAVVPLNQFETASRLSYFLWGSSPDDALLDAAAAGQLGSREQVATQARRLLGDARAHGAVNDFYFQWFGLPELHHANRDATAYPQWNDALRDAFEAETHAFVEHVIWQGDARLETLFTAPFTFVNRVNAPIYGLTAPDMTFRRVDLDPTQRAGFLTQPSLMTIHAKPNQSSPIHRGVFVRTRVLCQTLPNPPDDIPALPEPTPGLSTRQRFAQHSSDPACRGCHSLIDPLGFGFENFDAIGRYRVMEEGMAVDSSGSVNNTRDANGDYRGAVELARRLAASTDVRQCVTRQWFRFAQGRTEGEADACSLQDINRAFAASNYNLRDLLVAITQTDSFVHRRTE